VLEIEAPFGGIFHRVPNLPGGPLPIGYVIGFILDPGEAVPEVVSASPASATEGVTEDAPASASVSVAGVSQPASTNGGRKFSSPAARRRAKELGIDWTVIERPGGRPILLAHVEQYAVALEQQVVRVEASPVARRLAETLGVDLADVAAQTPGKKIERADVEAYVAARISTSAAPAPRPSALPGQTLPVSRTRRIITERMSESAHITAPVTLTTEADATELVTLREQAKARLTPRGVKVPSYNALLIKLVTVTLQDHPNVNVTLAGDEIAVHDEINIGLAVDTDVGLLVPVIHNTKAKSIEQITEEAYELAEKARARKLGPDHLSGGTFTVTNLGMYNIDAFTPIINLPEAAILGVGRIVSKPVVYDGEVVPRHMVALSLTFDHRVIDGGPAARFLDTVREYVERPYLWLTR
jgi:pyruvate dehydrogenase E2 component (dihydrolipoamide acetyltransferase)